MQYVYCNTDFAHTLQEQLYYFNFEVTIKIDALAQSVHEHITPFPEEQSFMWQEPP